MTLMTRLGPPTAGVTQLMSERAESAEETVIAHPINSENSYEQ